MFQDRQLDWFPRMRAMSLTHDDADGEQNDIRVLQGQLETTNRIVKELSLQLSELKDQVIPVLLESWRFNIQFKNIFFLKK